MLKELLILSSLAIISYASDDISKFAPYGTANGDSVLPTSDDGSWGPIEFDFHFYGILETQLYINNNGLITFISSISQFTPTGMSSLNYPAIAVYWGDVDTTGSNDGAVYYRSTTDSALLAHWSALVPDHNFHGVSAFIVTWYQVGYYYEHNDLTCTFQTILITDGTNSWVFDNYGILQWTTGDASDGLSGLSTTGNTAASVGFTAGDGINYVQTPLSLSNSVLNTTDFVTLVSGSVVSIQTCGNGIVEGTEQCDGGSCCTANCTFSESATCFCGRQNLGDGEMAYYCYSRGGFYQCVGGAYLSQSRKLACGSGTNCGCASGVECSCSLQQSPCVTAGTSQHC